MPPKKAASATENMPSERDLRRRLARHFGSRVSRANLWDGHVCKFTLNASSNWIPVLLEGSPLTKVTRTSYGGKKVEIWSNETFLVVSLYGEYRHLGGLSVQLRERPEGQWKCIGIFTANGSEFVIASRLQPPGEPLKELVKSGALDQLVAAIGLGKAERLIVHANLATLYLHSPTLERAIASISAVEEGIPESVAIEVGPDYSNLPSEFTHLIPFIKTWGLSDDDERTVKLKRSSKATRARLVRAVDPLLGNISSYLDSLADASGNNALELDALCQAAMEAKLTL